jgi:hypothetical protein
MPAIVDSIAALSTSVHSKIAKSFEPRSKLDSMYGSSKGVTPYIYTTYLLFALKWFVMSEIVSDGDFSAVMTLGAVVQFMGFTLLVMKYHVTGKRSLNGLSPQSMTLFASYLCLRLTSTCLKDGYIPVDPSGDWFYQLMDFGSLACVLYLLKAMADPEFEHYNDRDIMTVAPIVLPCIVLGFFIHGNLNQSYVFDAVWQISLNIETLSMLPQLMLLSKAGGKVDNPTCHWIACTVVSCLCRFQFWLYAWTELHDESPVAAWTIILLHTLQLLLCADFMFYYAKSFIQGREVLLPTSLD